MRAHRLRQSASGPAGSARITPRRGARTPHNEETEVEIRPVFEAKDFGAEFTPELREQEQRIREQAAARQK